jgi:protein TonB
MMSALALHEVGDRDGIFRWGGSAALMVALHAALIAAGTAWYRESPPPGAALPTIMVELAPTLGEPSVPQPKEALPVPDLPRSNTPSPEPPHQEAVQEPVAPTPPVEQSLPQTRPSPKPALAPTQPKSEPEIAIPEHARSAPTKPKPVHVETRKEEKKMSAIPRSGDAARSEHQAATASSTSAAPNPAAIAAYNQQVAAHLQSFKQYPASAKAAGEQGTSRLSFTLGRNGQLLGSRLVGSSGHPELDGETLAMVRRAQPFPPIPRELTQASISFTVPIRFSIR